jgi:ABC-type sulfate transport system substrate-binding protein
MQTIELSKFHHTKTHGFADPYVIYFVYPKDGQPVMVKGMYREVEAFVKETYPMSFYRWTMWKGGESRGSWGFACKDKYAMETIVDGRRRVEVSIFNNRTLVRKFTLRRMPKKWIPEFDV